MHVYHNYYKKIFTSNIKIFFVLSNIRMINLSLYEVRLIAQIRNISDYENKSKQDLIKALNETKKIPKQISKPEPEQIRKPDPEQMPKPEPEPKTEIKVNKKKLEKIRKDFDELRHKFFNKDEIKEYRKAFYVAKNKKISF